MLSFAIAYIVQCTILSLYCFLFTFYCVHTQFLRHIQSYALKTQANYWSSKLYFVVFQQNNITLQGHSMSNHPMGLTRPFFILMKLGVFVECDLTVPNLRFWVNQVWGLGDTAPEFWDFWQKRGVATYLWPLVSQELLSQSSQNWYWWKGNSMRNPDLQSFWRLVGLHVGVPWPLTLRFDLEIHLVDHMTLTKIFMKCNLSHGH